MYRRGPFGELLLDQGWSFVFVLSSLYTIFVLVLHTLVLHMNILRVSTLGVGNRSYLQSSLLQYLVLRRVSLHTVCFVLCSSNTRDR